MSETAGTTRDQFLGRIRAALAKRRQGGPTEAPPSVDDATARLTTGDDDLPTLFADRAEALGMSVVRCERATLVEAVMAQLGELGAGRVAIAVDRLDEAPALEATLRERGIEVGDWRGDPAMAAAFDADVGITDVKAAIAETGSLVYASDGAHGRGLMLAPPAHLAIVRASDVIPDMLDHMRRLDETDPAALAAGEVIISGPSKTADIEGVLITGVHGPGRLVVVFATDC